MSEEIWKEVPSLPGVKASSFGRLLAPEVTANMPHGGTRSYKTKPILGTKRKAKKDAKYQYYGWLYRGKNYKVHRLVCEAFNGNPPSEKSIVIHLDEDGLNNRAENLKWGSQKENMNMPKFIDYCKSRVGMDSPTAKNMAKKQCK